MVIPHDVLEVSNKETESGRRRGMIGAAPKVQTRDWLLEMSCGKLFRTHIAWQEQPTTWRSLVFMRVEPPAIFTGADHHADAVIDGRERGVARH